MRRLMMLTSALLLVSSTAQSQVDVATDTELRVAYCLGATDHEQASFFPTTGPNSLSEGKWPADSRLAKALREGAQRNADRRAPLLCFPQGCGPAFHCRVTSAQTWRDSPEPP